MSFQQGEKDMRPTSLFLLAAPAFVLASCGGAPSGPQSKEQVATEMAKAEKLKPGKYETVVTVSKIDLPGMPPQAKEQMQAMMGKPTKSEHCLTPEKADQGVKEMLGKMNGDCTYSNFDVSGSAVTGTMACKAPAGGATMNASFEGVQTAESSRINIKTEVSQPGGPGKMTMEAAMEMKRVGDCKA
jgi:hypothetical protein